MSKMARSFNGTTDIINVSGWYPNATYNNLTVQCWIYIPSLVASPVYCPFSQDGIGVAGNRVWDFAYNGSQQISAYVFSGGAPTQAIVASASTANTWYHILATYRFVASGTSLLNIYQNYFNQGSSSTAVGPLSGAGGAPVTIGGRGDAGQFFPGYVADCAIWSDVLSLQEIFSLSQAVVRPWQVRPGSLLGFWPLDGYKHPAFCHSGAFRFNGVLSGSTFVPGPPLLNAAPILTMPPSNQAMSPIQFVPPPAFILMPQIVM
jgi:hypothetical protein